jgi:hypothetical protein
MMSLAVFPTRAERTMNADTGICLRVKEPGRRDMKSAYGWLGGVCVLVAVVPIGLAACSSGSTAPQVASLGSSSGASGDSGSSASPQPTGNPTQLLDEWATCMRSHGDPSQADPTIDANKVIHIQIPPGVSGQNGPIDFKSGGFGTCDPYLTGAATALRGGQPPQKPDPVKLEKFSQCMRANGISDFPDPTGDGLQIRSSPGSDLNPNNPAFQNAQKKCAQQVGVPQLAGGTPQPGSIMVTAGNGGGVNGTKG